MMARSEFGEHQQIGPRRDEPVRSAPRFGQPQPHVGPRRPARVVSPGLGLALDFGLGLAQMLLVNDCNELKNRDSREGFMNQCLPLEDLKRASQRASMRGSPDGGPARIRFQRKIHQIWMGSALSEYTKPFAIAPVERPTRVRVASRPESRRRQRHPRTQRRTPRRIACGHKPTGAGHA